MFAFFLAFYEPVNYFAQRAAAVRWRQPKVKQQQQQLLASYAGARRDCINAAGDVQIGGLARALVTEIFR